MESVRNRQSPCERTSMRARVSDVTGNLLYTWTEHCPRVGYFLREIHDNAGEYFQVIVCDIHAQEDPEPDFSGVGEGF